MHRAYSLLTIKAIDKERRIITGIATTPEPDRVGDVVEPLGVKFKNPLPLLLFHDHTNPVGTVRFDKPTKDGITFEAHLPEIDEPGPLKTAVDHAWQLVKRRLVRGVSIGFRVLNDAMDLMRDTGGIRFRETEVLELSLVTVPANQDATIHTIKSADQERALSGSTPSVSSPAAALSPRPRRDRSMKKTVSDKITALRTQRKSISDRMAALMQPVLDEEIDTLDDENQKEYDELAADLKTTDEDIIRFEALERASVIKATPVIGTTSEDGQASRGHRPHITVKSNLPPGIEFARYAICKVAGPMFGMSPLDIARERYPDNPRIQALLKAAVAGATTTDSTWAAPLVSDAQTLTSEFLEYLRPMTIVGKFGTNGIPSLTRVPFNVRVQSQTSGGSANWVGQGKLKPVTKFDYADISLTWAKIAAISVLADELIRFSNPASEGRVRDALTGAVVERMDRDFIDPDKAAVSNVSPASITNGITGLTPSTGGDAADVRNDVAQAMGTFITANQDVTNLVWIMSASTALQLSLMRNALGNREFPDITVRGGLFEGFPVIVSQYAAVVGSPTPNLVVLVNAKEIFLADDGGVSIDASNQASIEMSDDPENEAGTVVSMYQSNQVALKAERYINWARGRNSAVAWLDAVAWTAPGSP